MNEERRAVPFVGLKFYGWRAHDDATCDPRQPLLLEAVGKCGLDFRNRDDVFVYVAGYPCHIRDALLTAALPCAISMTLIGWASADKPVARVEPAAVARS